MRIQWPSSRISRFDAAQFLLAAALIAGCEPTTASGPQRLETSGITLGNGAEVPSTAGGLVPAPDLVARARNQTVVAENHPIYFSGNGLAYSPHWSGLRWSPRGSALCLSDGRSTTCLDAFRDSATGRYFLEDLGGTPRRIAAIEPGDSRRLAPRGMSPGEVVMTRIMIDAILGGGGGGASQGGTGFDPWNNPVDAGVANQMHIDGSPEGW